MRSVSFLRPLDDCYVDALASYRRANFSEAIRLLGAVNDLNATALLARSYIREGRAEQALGILADLDASDLGEVHACEMLAVRAAAKTRLRDFAGASADLMDARVYGLSSNVIALQSEIEYFSSVLRYAEGDIDGAAAASKRALSTESISRTWMRTDDGSGYPHSLALSEARALEMLGFVSASQYQHEDQIRLMFEANRRFDESPIDDVFVEASLLHNYALIAQDLDHLADADYLQAKVEKIKWVESTRTFEFYVRQTLGWSKGSSGDYLGALREFRLAADAAPTIPLKIVAIANRAFLARELNESFSSREDLTSALELSKRVDWESKTGEGRYALYLLAEQLAPFAPSKARELLDLYFGLKTPLAVLVAGNHDRRLRAYECFATAAVLEAEGNVQRATINALEAFAIFDSLRITLRAALVALKLSDLTGEPKYRAYVEKVASERPNSWLMRRYQAISVA